MKVNNIWLLMLGLFTVSGCATQSPLSVLSGRYNRSPDETKVVIEKVQRCLDNLSRELESKEETLRLLRRSRSPRVFVPPPIPEEKRTNDPRAFLLKTAWGMVLDESDELFIQIQEETKGILTGSMERCEFHQDKHSSLAMDSVKAKEFLVKLQKTAKEKNFHIDRNEMIVSFNHQGNARYTRFEQCMPAYFNFIEPDGREVKIEMEEYITITHVVLTPTLQVAKPVQIDYFSDNSIRIDYLIEYNYQKDNEYLVKGSSGLSIPRETDIIKFQCRGTGFIPQKGKTLVIISPPSGVNFDASERRKRLITFITCEISDAKIKTISSDFLR